MNNIASYLSVLMRYKQESRNWYKSEHNCNFAACPNAADTQLLLLLPRLFRDAIASARKYSYFSIFFCISCAMIDAA